MEDWQLTHTGAGTIHDLTEDSKQCSTNVHSMISAERQELSRGAVLLVNHQWVHSRFARVNCVFTVVKTTWFSCVEPGLGDTAGDAGISSPPSLASLFLASSTGTDSSSPLGSWEASFVSVSVVLLKPLESCSTFWEKMMRFKIIMITGSQIKSKDTTSLKNSILIWVANKQKSFLHPNGTNLRNVPYAYDWVSQAARLKMIHHKLRPRKNIFPSSLCLSWCMSSTPQFVCLLYPNM